MGVLMSLIWIFGGVILVVAAGAVLGMTLMRRSVRARLMARKMGAALGQCAPYPAGD
jgi:hypothetical protein